MLAETLEKSYTIPLLIIMFLFAKLITPVPNYCEPITNGYEALQQLELNLLAYDNYRPKLTSSFVVSKPCYKTLQFLRGFSPMNLVLSIFLIVALFLSFLTAYLNISYDQDL